MKQRTYKIGEAATMLNLKTYVLRFWETEFSQIVPLRTEKGQRLYTEKDIATLKRIRFLLHDRGLTIEGAKRVLHEEISRGHGFDESSLLYLDDEEFSSDSLFSLNDLQETTTDSHTAGAMKSSQVAPYTSESNNSFDELVLPFEKKDSLSSSSPLQQVRSPNQPIASGILEQHLRQYIIDELESIAKMLRSRVNSGDLFQ